MKIALVKISAIEDRLVPLGLACLQAYLKSKHIPVQVYNFRAKSYSITRGLMDPLIQSEPLNLIMNHTDFPILIPVVDKILGGTEPDFNIGIFPELCVDYAKRFYDTPWTQFLCYK